MNDVIKMKGSSGPTKKIQISLFLVLVSSQFVMAYAEEIPLGFQKLPDGNIMVSDPLVAVPPPGYRINQNAILQKVAETTVASQESRTPELEDVPVVPPGFHRMPDGSVMANSPATAVVPDGYRLSGAGILVKQEEVAESSSEKLWFQDDSETTPASSKSTVSSSVNEAPPPGFHRMPDGTLMANSTSNANVPAGYHMMADGTLMANSGGHHHGAGMWMFDYKLMRMEMDGLRDTTKRVSAEQVIDASNSDYTYTMSPTDMTMDMHMFMVMYGITDKLMVMGMGHYMSNDMGMIARGSGGGPNIVSSMETSGIADTVISGMYQDSKKITYNFGLSLPTGSIDERGLMTHAAGIITEVKYPYGMQLGSGTYDLKHGIEYKDNVAGVNWGVAYEYTARLGENDKGYSLGNLLLLDGWMQWNITNTLSTKGKLQFRSQEQIDGSDKDIINDPTLDLVAMSPSMDSQNYGGTRVDLGVSLKYQSANMISYSAEIIMPIHEDLYGPQMSTDWIFGLGIGYMF